MSSPQSSKSALITGVTGQDGAYLAELLLGKGYTVHGMVRHASSANTGRVQHLKQSVPGLHLHSGDLTDAASLLRLVGELKPDEIYNLGAQSHVAVSFQMADYTTDCNAGGTLRLLDAIRIHGLNSRTRFYQASTSEMFGNCPVIPQDESAPFHPRSPYGVSKLHAHWITVNYREAYGLFACSGLLFNHESPRRGEHFVSRKITRALARMHHGLDSVLALGNLEAKRDWGHARDYVEAQWLMLQQARPNDYVIATGIQHSVREFVSASAAELGLGLDWQGEGVHEVAIAATVPADSAIQPGQIVLRIDPQFFRPTEVPNLLGNAAKARTELGWQPRTTFADLVKEMLAHDLALARREAAQAGS